MFAQERKNKIADIIKSGQSVKVSELARMFKVSESTVRRDLNELETAGALIRTHGGAVGSFNTGFEPSFSEKQDKYLFEKDYIGKLAARLINDNDTVIIDAGTTTQYIARYITAGNVTIITNSVNLANELSSRDDIEVIVTGGVIRPNTKAMAGFIAENTLRQFRADKAFIGANGVSIKYGVTTPSMIEANVKRAMIENAKEVYLLADSSKFNETAFSLICPVSRLNYIVTNHIEENERLKFEKLSIKVITE